MSDTTKERVQAVINSKDRLNPSTESTTNFTYSFNDKIDRISEIIIKAIEIPYTYYTVNSTNNVLSLNSNANSITITPGNYTASTLIAELETLLDVELGITTTVTFSTTTYKITVAHTSPFVIDSIDDQPTSTFAPLLGFHTSSVSGTSAIADSALDLAGSNYLLVMSDFLTKYVSKQVLYANNTLQTTLHTIPVNASPGDVIFHEPQYFVKLSRKIDIDTTDIIDIQLRDEFNNIVDLNNLDWAIQIVFVTN